MSKLKVEQIGGFGGIGIANTRYRAVGEIDMKELSAADKKVIEGLFASKSKVALNSSHPLRFRISRGMESIEVDEKDVPDAVKNCVRGEFI